MKTELPITKHEEEIIAAIGSYPVIIVVGETGSGKTTQIPQFLYRARMGMKGTIGVTEPRRIAATSVARFVAEELGVELGGHVGYQVRFDRTSNRRTFVKFMTDGILLQEFQIDPNLSDYHVIMIDEAHERSTNIDFTLGLLKDLLKRRKDLKVIISSATIDAQKFSDYFGNAPIINVSGRAHPVDIRYSEGDYDNGEMPDAVIEKITEIHTSQGEGDILVFMTGADDINEVIGGLEKANLKNLVPLPAHGGLSPKHQQAIFDSYPGKRKVIVATNIAETSITVDGVVYVVDSGLIKQTSFNPRVGFQSLDVADHSQSGCDQRAGRAGRTKPGVCYRMFTEESFKERPEFTKPEIMRTSLDGVVLSMENLGIENITEFDFVDHPGAEAFLNAYKILISLGAIKVKEKGFTEITELGKEMASLPFEPRIARMILEAKKYGCVKEVATIAAFLSVRSVFVRPKDHEDEADTTHAEFKDARSDALTFLSIWEAYSEQNFNRQWCHENFLHSRSMWEVKSIREQLLNFLFHNNGIEITQASDDEVILRSVAAGLIHNLLGYAHRFSYNGVMDDDLSLYDVYIHPGSSMFGRFTKRWIVAAGIARTKKLYARGCSMVKPEWLPELAPSRFYFGPPILVRYNIGDDVVSAQIPIMQMQRNTDPLFPPNVAHIIETEIPLNEARELQEERIRLAQITAKTYILEVRTEDYGEERMLDKKTGRYFDLPDRLSSLGIPEGATYCKITSGRFGQEVAEPLFRVLDLGEEGRENRREPVSTEDAAAILAKNLGGVVKKK